MPITRAEPAFEEIRADAYAVLGNVIDGLRFPARPGPDTAQQVLVEQAVAHITMAREKLNQAARP